ncbi:MAG: sigma-54-dependent Fis family transcriptional regulator [Deltaproteobacteria bacterium]|nr:MAG: sigma-54-dependent Fis family transcriptional regulator [Deltaproteobacteria bacterium]
MDRVMSDAMLHVLGDLIHKEIHVAPMLSRMVDVMASQLEADRGTVFLLNENGEELISVAAHLPEIKEIRVPITQGVAGYVARTGELVSIPTENRDVPIWRNVDKQTGYHTQSMLAGPLRTHDCQLMGVVQILNKRSGPFTTHDKRVFQALTEQASALLEQTTLRQTVNCLPTEALNDSIEAALGTELPLGDRFNRIVGTSDPIRRVLQTLRRVAPTQATVLLRGETGTGKGLFARALHHNSSRSHAPLIHVDCTTLPEGLVESELFGHERGAFTGANQRKQGKVESAQGGTLFLDEIGEMPLSLQSKLLTLLQDQKYHRLGSTQPQHADIRVVAATNRSLEALVQQGLFREDLYYRLRVVEIPLPSLRERGQEDLLRLVNHFISKASKRHRFPIKPVTPEALEKLLSYPWPGNVRELENCMESAIIFADDAITPDCISLPTSLPESPSHSTTQEQTSSQEPLKAASTNEETWFAHQPTLADLEARYISHMLQECDGNRSQCARILGIGRNTLLRKLKAYGLTTPDS